MVLKKKKKKMLTVPLESAQLSYKKRSILSLSLQSRFGVSGTYNGALYKNYIIFCAFSNEFVADVHAA